MGWSGVKKGTACYSVMQVDCQESSILGTLAQHFFFFFWCDGLFFCGTVWVECRVVGTVPSSIFRDVECTL